MRKLLAFGAGLGMLASACSDGGALTAPSTTVARPHGGGGSGETTEVRFATALRQVGDCDALLAHLRTEALERVGPYGIGAGGGWGFPIPVDATARVTVATPAAEGSDGARAPSSANSQSTFSTTNVQEAGIDEPDIVKTDGSRIVTLSNGTLSVIDTTANPPARTGHLTLSTDDAAPHDFLIDGDRVLVFGSAWKSTDDDNGRSASGRAPSGIAASDVARGPWAPGNRLATITEVSLADPTNPTAGKTLRVDGWYLTSRLVDGTARVVLRSEPAELPFVYPQSEAGEDRAEQANREVIEQSTIDDWMPSYELRSASGSTVDSGLLADCDRVEAPTEFAGFGTLSVLTLPMDDSLDDGDATAVLAAGETAYASATGLYVATTSYLDPRVLDEGGDAVERWNRDFSTSIHAFDITGTDPAGYRASGTVPGHLLNQFAMSEHEGNLRVATTKGMPWGASEQSESILTVLEPNGAELTQVGQVGDMGRGERIYSVRYAGDIAYVVTFRQTDPFYTVDLSDPTAPALLGELKIPGYSSYLHPIGDDLVIGVGQHADDQGRTQGTKVSLFDVSDLAAPAEIAWWTLPHSSSNAEHDHHAFLYWPATQQLVVPLNQWRDGEGARSFAGAVVLHVDRSGITKLGRVEHPRTTPSAEELCGVPEPTVGDAEHRSPVCEPRPQADPIQRSLVIGDDLWTVGTWTLQQSALDDLARQAVVPIT